MRRIVINTTYGNDREGGFCLSHAAFLRLRALGQPQALAEADPAAYWPQAAGAGEPSFNQCGRLIPRDDERLVQVVMEMGAAANGHCADLKIVEVPGDVDWEITRVDGVEHVSEVHRTWS